MANVCSAGSGVSPSPTDEGIRRITCQAQQHDANRATRIVAVLAIILALSLLALIGVPPTGIFIAKLYVFTAAVDSGLIWLAILGVINSAVSAYYYIKIIRVMFTRSDDSEEKISASPAPWLALWIAGAAMVFMGIAPGFVMEAAQNAVKALAV